MQTNARQRKFTDLRYEMLNLELMMEIIEVVTLGVWFVKRMRNPFVFCHNVLLLILAEERRITEIVNHCSL
jgi:hypothetical protein